jgi:hypothetical protein
VTKPVTRDLLSGISQPMHPSKYGMGLSLLASSAEIVPLQSPAGQPDGSAL